MFAIPGSIHSPFSKGSHRLIKEGAKLVETAQDVLEELGGVARAGSCRGADARRRTFEGDAGRVLDALGHDPAGVDALTARTGLAAGAVSRSRWSNWNSPDASHRFRAAHSSACVKA